MANDLKKKFNLSSMLVPNGDQPQAIEKIVQQLRNNGAKSTLLGVTGSGKTFTMANVISALDKKTLVLAPNKTLAAQLYQEFKEFFPHNSIEYFISYYDYYQPEAFVPSTNTYIEKDASINQEIDKLRHRATRSLLEKDDVIVVSSVSCIYGIGSPEEYLEARLKIYRGQKISLNEFMYQLIDRQYQRTDALFFERGSFKIQGDIVELIPSTEEELRLRIEFFDQEIDSIKWIGLKGEVVSIVDKVDIYPKSHYVIAKERINRAIITIRQELRERLQELENDQKLLERDRLEKRTLLDLEMLEELGFCPGIENYTRHLHEQKIGDPPPTLVDYFGKDFLLIVDESHLTISQVAGMSAGDRSRKSTLVDHGFRLPSALDNRPLHFHEFEQRYDRVLFVSATPGDYELVQTKGEFVEQIIRPTGLLDPIVEVVDSSSQVKHFLGELRKRISLNQKALATTLTKKLSEELTSYYRTEGVRVSYMHSDLDALERLRVLRSLRQGDIDLIVGINLLREGLDLPEVSLVGIFDADKEGFLRSKRSLIQTIGRVARHQEGTAVLYARGVTESMRMAIEETERRRKYQQDYNQKNGIIPASIIKKTDWDLLPEFSKNIIENSAIYSVDEIDRKIASLRLQMKNSAKLLDFDHATKMRNEIQSLEKVRMLL